MDRSENRFPVEIDYDQRSVWKIIEAASGYQHLEDSAWCKEIGRTEEHYAEGASLARTILTS